MGQSPSHKYYFRKDRSLALYERIRAGDTSLPFWDLIVLTASDEKQAGGARVTSVPRI